MSEVAKRIRKAYQNSLGDWCYEKGKSREVKFLKEACEQLDWSSRQSDVYWKQLNEARNRVEELEEELEHYK